MSRVALIGENSIECVDALIDIWNNGDCAVLIDWRIPFMMAVEMMREASVKQCFIENWLIEDKDISEVNDIEFITFERNSNSAQCLPIDVYNKFQNNYNLSEAVVIYSSGTTGKSKGIILSHFAINTNADAIIDYMLLKKNDCIYIAKTLSHSSTLTGELLVALKTRTKLVIAPTIVPPRFVINNIEKYKVSIIGVNPTLLNMYADEVSRNGGMLSSLKTIYVSGSVLSDKIYNKAHNVFGNVSIYNVYGLSEAGPRVTAQTRFCCKNNSVGKPIKDVQIAVISDDGRELSNNEHGIIYVDTKTKYSGYILGYEKHKSLYKDWLNTGDFGYIDDDDELHICGRIDNVITVDSHKIYPEAVEDIILSIPEVDECAVFYSRTKKHLICIYTSFETLKKKYLFDFCKYKLANYEIPMDFIHVDHIEKNINQKIKRSEVQNGY